MTKAPTFIVGLDLGQAHDFTAWIVVQRHDHGSEPPTYDVPHIDRIRGAAYPKVVEHTQALVTALRQAPTGGGVGAEPIPPGSLPTIQRSPKPSIAIDYTGVGRPVVDLLYAAKIDATLQPVTITGGESMTRGERGEYRVPKRDLASSVQVLLQSGRLRIGEHLALARTLTSELVNFRVKISLSGHDSYGAGDDWRQNAHDDLVLALAMACWFGERHKPPPIVSPLIVRDRHRQDRGGFGSPPERPKPPEDFGRGRWTG